MLTRTVTLSALGLLFLAWTAGPLSALAADKLVVLPLQDQTETPSDGPATLTRIVGDYFGRSNQVTILSEDQLQSILGSETGSRDSLTQTVAAKTGCDKVLTFTLERYSQRVGSDISVTDPASLAFKFRVLNAPEGRMLCSGRYDETQQPLSENILDFSQARKRGFKWITVEAMAEKAVQDRFDGCQDLKDLSSIK